MTSKSAQFSPLTINADGTQHISQMIQNAMNGFSNNLAVAQ
jgi:hypothetical protein